MTDIISYILLALGISLMVAGYRRNNRSMLVSAGLVLWISAGVGDAVHGFVDGWNEGRGARASTSQSG